MEKIIEVGRCYSFKRTYSREVRGQLVEWSGQHNHLTVHEFNGRGILGLDGLSDAEFATMVEIEPETKKP